MSSSDFLELWGTRVSTLSYLKTLGIRTNARGFIQFEIGVLATGMNATDSMRVAGQRNILFFSS